jgi:hypothetical protein
MHFGGASSNLVVIFWCYVTNIVWCALLREHRKNVGSGRVNMKIYLLSVLAISNTSLAFRIPHPKNLHFTQDFSRILLYISSIDDTDHLESQKQLERDVRVQNVLMLARRLGPVGSLVSDDDQNQLERMANELVPWSDPNPSHVILNGVHNLVYSASPGSSSGRIGNSPFYGRVTQQFLDHDTNPTIISKSDRSFVNSVEFGPLVASLRASKSIKNETTNLVYFHQTTIQFLGITILDKEIKGVGFWKYLFMGTIIDTGGQKKLIRIMETPSLFILEQPLN